MRFQDFKEICGHRNHYMGPVEWSCDLIKNHLESACSEENCQLMGKVTAGVLLSKTLLLSMALKDSK